MENSTKRARSVEKITNVFKSLQLRNLKKCKDILSEYNTFVCMYEKSACAAAGLACMYVYV